MKAENEPVMNGKLTVTIALLAGLAGGMLTRFVAPAPVFAQARAATPAELRARSFTLTDQYDHAVGTFTSDAGRIVLRDGSGREVWSAGGSTLKPLSANIR
jgi:hypothetical protein